MSSFASVVWVVTGWIVAGEPVGGQDAGSGPKVGNALGQEVAPVGARLLGVDGDRVAVPHAGQGGEELWRHERIDSLEHACVLVCGLCLLSVVPGPVAPTCRGIGVLRLRPGRRCVPRLSSLRRVCAGERARPVRGERGWKRFHRQWKRMARPRFAVKGGCGAEGVGPWSVREAEGARGRVGRVVVPGCGETAGGLVRQARGMRRVSILMILMPLSVVVT